MAEINARGRRTRKRGQLPCARHCEEEAGGASDGYRRAIASAVQTVEIGGCRTISSMPALAPTHRCGSPAGRPVWFVLAVPDTLAALREKTARSAAPEAD